jgi:hypothetical protein
LATLTLTTLVLLVVIAVRRGLGIGHIAAVEAVAGPVCGLLGQRLGIDVHHRRADLLGDFGEDALELVGGKVRIRNLQRGGVGRAVLLLLAAHSVGQKRPAHDCHRKRAEKYEDRSETACTQPFEERFHEFVDLVRMLKVPEPNFQYIC